MSSNSLMFLMEFILNSRYVVGNTVVCILVFSLSTFLFFFLSLYSLFSSFLNLRFSIAHLSTLLAAYKHADGKKIDGRRVLVDVERGRTVKGWHPRRLGKHLFPNQVFFSRPEVSNAVPGGPMSRSLPQHTCLDVSSNPKDLD